MNLRKPAPVLRVAGGWRGIAGRSEQLAELRMQAEVPRGRSSPAFVAPAEAWRGRSACVFRPLLRRRSRPDAGAFCVMETQRHTGTGRGSRNPGCRRRPRFAIGSKEGVDNILVRAEAAGGSSRSEAPREQRGWKSITCKSGGTPFPDGGDPRTPSPDCVHSYRASSVGQPDNAYPVTATVHWSISWSGAGQSGTFPGMTTTTSVTFRVAESQALNTGGGLNRRRTARPTPATAPLNHIVPVPMSGQAFCNWPVWHIPGRQRLADRRGGPRERGQRGGPRRKHNLRPRLGQHPA